jgi:N-hydroxyarylamine O-acetyltransferase
MAHVFDLDAYLARIGHEGSRAPTLETLRAVHARHAATIAFEDLDPQLGRPVSLDVARLEAKMVRGRRGGYCFEQNALLRAALEALGFEVQAMLARMRWNRPADLATARTHMVLRIDLPPGSFIADVGFAGHGLAEPLKFDTTGSQPQSRGHYRLVQEGTAFELQVEIRGDWRKVYRLEPEPQSAIDFEAANWFTATHPHSQFVSTLIMGIVGRQDRHSLVNRTLKTRRADGFSTVRTLGTPAELAEVIEGLFHIAPPAPAEEIFARLP